MSHKILLVLFSLLMFGCSEFNQKKPVSLGKNMTECKIYRIGGTSTYYLLKIHNDEIEAQYFQSNVVKKSASKELSDQDYQQFIYLFEKALSQK